MKTVEKVKSILSELCGIESIDVQQNLQADLGLDSLQMITLLVMLEDHFGITLDEADMNPFDLISVESVVNLAEKYVGGDSNEKEG